MVMCIVVGCASKTDTAKGVGMFRIPSLIYNQGEETEELTRMRRERRCEIQGHLLTCPLKRVKEFVAATSCLGNLPSAGINTTSIGLRV